MNIINANNDSQFGSLKQGDVFTYHGDTFIKIPLVAQTNHNCIDLKTGDPVHCESDRMVQSHPTAELHLR